MRLHASFLLASSVFLSSVFHFELSGQVFSSGANFPINLESATGSCATPGANAPNIVRIPVTGLGNLSTTFQVVRVSVRLSNCGAGTSNLNNVQIRLQSPGGVCQGIYSGGLSTVASGTHQINLVPAASCLNNPNTSNANASGSGSGLTTGNVGYFNAQFNGTTTDFDAYTGNPNGDWLLVFSENTTTAPCLEAAEIQFGVPQTQNQEAAGETCINPIVWDGLTPLCASTNGKNGSTEMPGSLGGAGTTQFGTIGGQTCEWNNANNNDVWIAYTATSELTCLSISGTDQNLQSVVVTDANVDGDNNPCTGPAPSGGNDPRWTLVSCPRNSIYGSSAGTSLNQQHCFSSQPGKTYYLVVDGNGGANSSFYVWGSSTTIIPVRFGSFQANPSQQGVQLSWTALNEFADLFEVERSVDGTRFEKIGELPARDRAMAWFRSYTFVDKNFQNGRAFYRIKAISHNGSYRFSATRQVNQMAGNGLSQSIRLKQHPIQAGIIAFDANKPVSTLRLLTMQGVIVDQRHFSQQLGSINWQSAPAARGAHILSVHFADGSCEHQVVLINN